MRLRIFFHFHFKIVFCFISEDEEEIFIKSHLNSMLFEDVVSLLHLLDFKLDAERCRLDRVYRVHDNLEICQLLNVSIQVEPKSLCNGREKGDNVKRYYTTLCRY